MRTTRTLALAALVASLALSQTTNVYGTNELTINGLGYGATSCIPAGFPVNYGLSTNWSGLANSPIVLAVDSFCQINTVVLGPNNVVDLPFSAGFQIALDGTGGAAPSWLSQFLHTDTAGSFYFNIPYAPVNPGVNFALQGAFFNPAYPLGFQVSAAFTVSGPTPPTPPNLAPSTPACNPNATNIGLACDDCYVQVNLGFSYTYFGQSYTQAFVGSNGYITFGAGDTVYSEDPSWFAGGPARIAPLWDDQENISGNGGAINFYSDPQTGTFEVCWVAMQEFYASGPNTYKVTAFPGAIYFDYDTAIISNDCLAGLSPGNNIAPATSISIGAGGTVIAPGTAPYEQWDGFVTTFNLKGFRAVWAMDNTGTPIYQN